MLVVLSDENHLDLKDGKVLSTGFYLNELMQPVKLLLDAGHEVTFATPHGRAPTVDASSVTPAYFGNDAVQLTLHKELLEKLALTSPTASPVVSLARIEQQATRGSMRSTSPAPRTDAGSAEEPGAGPAAGRLPPAQQDHRAGLPRADRAAFHAAGCGWFRGKAGGGAMPGTPKWIYSGYQMTVISNQEEEQAAAAGRR